MPINKQRDSALNVNKGIDPPPSVDENAVEKFKQKKKKKLSVDDYVNGILNKDITILSLTSHQQIVLSGIVCTWRNQNVQSGQLQATGWFPSYVMRTTPRSWPVCSIDLVEPKIPSRSEIIDL